MRKYGIGQGKDGAIIPSPVGVFADEAIVAPPDPPNPAVARGGVEPLMTFAAKWFNFFQNYYTRNWNEAALDLEDLYIELQNILSAANIVPNPDTKDQLLQALLLIIADRTRDASNIEVTFTAEQTVKPLVPTNDMPLKTLFGIIGGWYSKLVSKNGNLFEVEFTLQDSSRFAQLVSGMALQDLFGRLTSWYDFIRNPNAAVITNVSTSTLFEPIRDGDSLQTIAGKLNKWYYNIAMVHATGLVPVLAEPPTGVPAAGQGYLWVDPALKKLRCRAMIDGELINVFTESGNQGGDSVRPLEVLFLKVNQYSNAFDKDIPAGPDSDYVNGGRPSDLGGFHWVDPIDYNFDHIEFIEPDGTKSRVQNGVQKFFPPAGFHDYIIKVVDVEGYASVGVEVENQQYYKDCNVFIIDAQTRYGDDVRAAAEFSVYLTDRIDPSNLIVGQPISGVSVLVGGTSYNPLFNGWDGDECRLDFKLAFTPGTRTNLITAGSSVLLNIAAGSGITKIDGLPMVPPPPNVIVVNNSEYLYPVCEEAYVTQDEVREIRAKFNSVLTATIQGWNVSGSSNSLQIIGITQNNDTELAFTFNKPVIQTDTIVLNYNGTVTKDYIGYPVQAFTQAVTNESSYLPINVESAQIPNGEASTLMLVFTGRVTLPNTDGWTLSNTASNIISVISTNDTVAMLQLDAPVLESDGPQVSYNALIGQTVDYESQMVGSQAALDVANNAHDTMGDVLDANISGSDPEMITLYMSEAVQLFDLTGWKFYQNGTLLDNSFITFTVEDFRVVFEYKFVFMQGDNVQIQYDGQGTFLDGLDNPLSSFSKTVNNHSTRSNILPVSAVFVEDAVEGFTSEGIEVTFNADVTITDWTGFSIPYAYPITEAYPNVWDSYNPAVNPDWKDVWKYEIVRDLDVYIGLN